MFFFNMIKKISLLVTLAASIGFGAQAGNPDRQGEAGAYELLINPWARSAGLMGYNTATVNGVEALWQNVAGAGRIGKSSTEIGFSRSFYLQGTGLSVTAAGFVQKVGTNGVLGINLNAFNFGEIAVTTAGQPEGTGATLKPVFFNVGLSYGYNFADKVHVGIIARGVNQVIGDATAFGLAIDAGVQYVGGNETYTDRFKFGISLRNIGTRLRYSGQSLTRATQVLNNDGSVNVTTSYQAQSFELPSQLNIGVAYDLLPTAANKLTAVGNFTANAFTRDEAMGGLEFALNDLFSARAAYRYELGTGVSSINSGISGGFSVNIPLDRDEKQRRLSLDYGYMHTRKFSGTHNITLRLNL
ncbi:MAG: hypothetical protein RL757_642 [Bacteroidota bacterium]|jgi:hypothetical protein